MSDEIKTILNRPTITQFRCKDIAAADYVIFETTIEELVRRNENTPVLDAQIRALTAALKTLQENKARL